MLGPIPTRGFGMDEAIMNKATAGMLTWRDWAALGHSIGSYPQGHQRWDENEHPFQEESCLGGVRKVPSSTSPQWRFNM